MASPAKPRQLTSYQRDVFRLAEAGLEGPEIALRLGSFRHSPARVLRDEGLRQLWKLERDGLPAVLPDGGEERAAVPAEERGGVGVFVVSQARSVALLGSTQDALAEVMDTVRERIPQVSSTQEVLAILKAAGDVYKLTARETRLALGQPTRISEERRVAADLGPDELRRMSRELDEPRRRSGKA